MRHFLTVAAALLAVAANAATVEVSPRVALLDKQVAIRVRGLEPRSEVILRASCRDGNQHAWTSEATFTADDHGTLDVTRTAPVSGTYSGIDPMGLFWSMTSAETPGTFIRGSLRSYDVTIEALSGGTPIATTTATREIVASPVAVADVHDGDVVGRYYAPAAKRRHAALLVLTGSNGGIPDRYAQLLASHGYPVLAQAYFKAPGTPDDLVEIPIEILEHGLQWLAARSEVDPNRIGVLGNSKGGEAALLLGSMFPQIKAVVAHAPSAYVWEAAAVRKNGVMVQAKRDRSSWTYHGTPLPYVPKVVTPEAEAQMKQSGTWTVGMYNAALDQIPADVLARAAIPVEKINGAVMLLSTRADALWPSDRMSRTVMERLKERNHPFADERVSYEQAGHVIEDPNVPTPVPARKFSAATPAAAAAAAADSWPRVLRFLERNLQNRKP